MYIKTLPPISISSLFVRNKNLHLNHCNRNRTWKTKEKYTIFEVLRGEKQKHCTQTDFPQKVYWHAVDCSIHPPTSKPHFFPSHHLVCFSSSLLYTTVESKASFMTIFIFLDVKSHTKKVVVGVVFFLVYTLNCVRAFTRDNIFLFLSWKYT